MACTIKSEDIARVKRMGFLNNKGTDLFNGRVLTVNGKLTPEQAAVLAEAVRKFGTAMEFTTRLCVEVQGIHYDNIPAFQEYIAQAELYTGGTGPYVRPVVSCKGTTCQYGLYDTFDLSEKIHERFYKGYHDVKLPHKFKIACGGCPNNCVKPTLNDLGIVGQLIKKIDLDACRGCKKCKIEAACPMHAAVPVDGKITIDTNVCTNCGRCVGKCPFNAINADVYGWRVYIGGRWGKKWAHANPISKLFTDETEVLDFIEKTILYFRENGKTGERFADTINRIGFENVDKALLEDDILARKQQIIEAELK